MNITEIFSPTKGKATDFLPKDLSVADKKKIIENTMYVSGSMFVTMVGASIALLEEEGGEAFYKDDSTYHFLSRLSYDDESSVTDYKAWFNLDQASYILNWIQTSKCVKSWSSEMSSLISVWTEIVESKQ
ncbi:hypothetical protein SAMN02745181_0383 [Rubritalea squalenifaciens DSM 18772]|uniref:Uncharacterized protein n=1 Tax=Rubritalea squalenifaciens DSM 18772 TaxID=1123071 RepID=A0A1M6C4Z7_9BACT|nr:hypothetical protein [Rubritalea squalenifaciens]SHI55808.1 hypothetical protein SAMN02745181_0383 [Rubritalea squalenifaciens DSM 18772]